MPELSLREELGDAIEDASNEPVDTALDEPSTPAAEPTEKPAVDKTRDEQGKFAAKQAEETISANPAAIDPNAQIKPVAGQEPAPDAKSLVTPPATWSASAKAVYATLPETARKEIAKREQDYARGIQQHAEHAKGYQTMMREFQPYEAMMRAEGGTPEGAIRDLMKTSYMLRTGTPQERGQLVMQIAQRFGADVSQFTGKQAEQPAGQQEFMPQIAQYVQQLVNPHLQRIQSWEQGQQTAQQQQQQALQHDTVSQIEAFQNATAEDGISPKHVYFENVRELMSGYFASGQATSLDQAYDMACWANPEVRAALQANLQRSTETQRLEDAKRKTADARKAGFNVSGQGGVGISGSTHTSLRDELSSQLESAMGGGRL